jgi:Ca2+-transporting ATPase
MITGDHAVTAAAIGGELGITGKAITGAQFSAIEDEELVKQIQDIGVIARVSPEDKIRLVRVLQQIGNIVSMTGDGVNDAPALKKADIGVAMGITGTEVSKDAAVMILTDDNFATIVKAVEFGRAIYSNLRKYIRFQMATLVGFIASFLGAAVFRIASGIPFTPLQALWINFAIGVPIAIALGFDKPEPGLMEHKPRPIDQPVLTLPQWVRIVVLGLVMATGVLWVRANYEPTLGAAIAATMSLTTFSLFTIFAGLCIRNETQSVFNRDILGDSRQLTLYGVVILLTILATELGIFQRILDTTPLSGDQWLVCIGVSLTLVVVDEVWKVFLRRSRTEQAAPAVAVPMVQTSQNPVPVTSKEGDKK